MKRSIVNDLVICLVCLSLCFCAITTFFSWRYFSANASEEAQKRVTEAVSNLSTMLQFPVWSVDTEMCRTIGEITLSYNFVSSVKITSFPGNTVLFHETAPEREESFTQNEDIYYKGKLIGHITMGFSDIQKKKNIQSVLLNFLEMQLLLVTATLAATVFLLRYFLKAPFHALLAGITRFAEGDYSYKFTTMPQEELKHIIEKFRAMALKIQHREETLKTINDQLKDEMQERIKKDQETLHLKDILKDILDSTPSQLIGVDEQGRVIQWNRQAEDITGIPESTAMGEFLEDVHPDLPLHKESIQQAVTEQQVIQKTQSVDAVVENSAHYEITVFPLTKELRGAIIRIDEITDRVQMQNMMVQTEKMISVGGLAAGMAHEINNPLGGILQNTQNIQRRLLPDLPANQRVAKALAIDIDIVRRYLNERKIMGMLDNIKESGSRAAQIVNNMLNFSRKSESSFMTCDINELIDNTLTLATSDYDLKKRYDFRKVAVVKDYATDLPSVICTETEIEQVLFNLLKNATQAMATADSAPEQPAIRLKTYTDGGSVVIEVQDNGPGMDADTKKRVFEPFYTTKAPGEGTGLGLSVSFFIVTQNHGGSFTVDSTPGKGTTFYIRLPLRQA